MEWGLIITIIGALVTVVSAVLTIRALSLAKKQNNQAIDQTIELQQLAGEQNKVTNKITEIANELDRIQESLSTRYIGTIKDYLPLVVDQIKTAEKSITILCDFPAYGYFTDNDSYKKYRIAIRDRIDNAIKVSLMCLDKNCRADSNRKVLSITEENWKGWKQNQEHGNWLHNLGYNNEDIDKLRVEDFLADLESVDQEMLDIYCKGADLEDVNALIPFDFWIIDDRKAIFAFSTYSGDASQYGFLTLDEKLISALKDIKDRYHRKKVQDNNMREIK
jgi:hypothetical protein